MKEQVRVVKQPCGSLLFEGMSREASALMQQHDFAWWGFRLGRRDGDFREMLICNVKAHAAGERLRALLLQEGFAPESIDEQLRRHRRDEESE